MFNEKPRNILLSSFGVIILIVGVFGIAFNKELAAKLFGFEESSPALLSEHLVGGSENKRSDIDYHSNPLVKVKNTSNWYQVCFRKYLP